MNEKQKRIDALGDFFVKSAEAFDSGEPYFGVDPRLVRSVIDTLSGSKAERDYLHTVVLDRLGVQGASMLKGFVEGILDNDATVTDEEKRSLHSSASFLSYLCRDVEMARFHSAQSPGDSLSGLAMRGIELIDERPPEGLIVHLLSGGVRKDVERRLRVESV